MMKLSSIINSNRFLSSVACTFTRLKNRDFNQIVEARKMLDIFDYQHIAMPLPKCYNEICTDNNCFGIGFSIRDYSGWHHNHINQFVEHGYFFGEYVSEQEKQSFAKTILTFSKVREMHIHDNGIKKEVIPIGPYIHYAPQYYNNDIIAEYKAKLGKTLLVFFSHGATGCTVEFDLDYMISKIEEIRGGFDSVVVSLFWSDINDSVVSKLKSHGYLIFSAGHRYDSYFLSRQKTMITLADATMSNSISTHIAYCIYLGKPHWYIEQDVKKIAHTATGTGNIQIANSIKTNVVANMESNEIKDALSVYSPIITEHQYNVCNKYFGFDQIKTKEEMFHVISTK